MPLQNAPNVFELSRFPMVIARRLKTQKVRALKPFEALRAFLILFDGGEGGMTTIVIIY